MIIELIIIAIIFIIIIAILKKMMIISFKLFGVGIAILIILAILGYLV